MISLATLASLFIHLCFVAVLKITPNKEVPKKATQIEFVVQEKEPALAKMPNEKRKKLVQKKKKLEKQIVQQKKARNNERPEDTRFLSKFNQRVVQEMSAQKSGKFKNTEKNSDKLKGSKSAKKSFKKSVQKLTKGNMPTLRDLKPKMNLAENLGDEGKDNKKGEGERSQTSDYLKDLAKGPQTL